MPRPAAATTALAALALLATVAGCSPSTYGALTITQGDGPVTSQPRTTPAFRRIRVGDGLRLDARTGTARSVSVAAQANLLPLIATTVTDGELAVSLTQAGIASNEPLSVTVVAPALDAVQLDTGASGTLDVTTPALELDVTGGASVAADGAIGSLDLRADIGGNADLAGARVDDATVSIEGGATATIAPAASVTGVVEPAGRLILVTRPPQVEVDVRMGGTMIDG